MRCESQVLLVLVIIVLSLCSPLATAAEAVEDDAGLSSSEDVGLAITVNEGRSVTFSTKVLVNVTLNAATSLDPDNYTLYYSSYPTNSSGEATNSTVDLDSLNVELSFNDTLSPVPGNRETECRTDVWVVKGEDTGNETVVVERSSMYSAGKFTLEIDPKTTIGPSSITESEFIYRANGKKEPITDTIKQRVYEGLKNLIHEKDKDASALMKIVMNEEGGGKEIETSSIGIPTKKSKTKVVEVSLPLLQNRTESVKINLLGTVEMENKYGIGPLKLGLGGNSIYGTQVVDYDYSREVSTFLPFTKRPFIMYSGEQVLKAREGIQMYASRPATYDYPRMFDELMEWNRDVQTSRIPVAGESELGASTEGWVRVLPQPMIAGYDHRYIPKECELRVIGHVPEFIQVGTSRVHVEKVRLNDSFGGEERMLGEFSLQDINENNVKVDSHFEAGTHKLRLYYKTPKKIKLEFEQTFYVHSGKPKKTEFLQSNGLGSLFANLSVSQEVEERGWKAKNLDNSENIKVKDEGTDIYDVKKVVGSPNQDSASQTPYGAIVQRSTQNSLSHYKFAVCNIYRPHPFFCYALLKAPESKSFQRDISTKDGTVKGTITAPSIEFDFRGLFGEEYEMKRYHFEKGATEEDIENKFDEDYEYISVQKLTPTLDVHTDKILYEKGEKVTLKINLSVPGWTSSEVEGQEVKVSGCGIDKTIEMNESGRADLSFEAEHGGVVEVKYEGYKYLVDERVNAVQIVTKSGSDLLSSIIQAFGVGMILALVMVFYAGIRHGNSKEKWNAVEFLEDFFGG